MSKPQAPEILPEVFQAWPKEAQEHIIALQIYHQAQFDELKAQLDELKARLSQNSQNSSKPPSSDPPWQRPPKKSNKTKEPKPQGGQVGHVRHTRPLLPLEEVAEIVEYRPSQCEKCWRAFTSSDQVGEPVRHQVWEIPRSRAGVTEYQLYEYECRHCQHSTTTLLPPGVPSGNFGPNLVASLAVLHGQYQLSLRQTQEAAHDLWGVELSLGAIADCCTKTSRALAPAYHQVEQTVQGSTRANVDETGWYRAGQLEWLWVAVCLSASLFKITGSRCGKSLKALIGENYSGIIHSDRHKPYLALSEKLHQLCWAHLIRNMAALGQRAGPAEEWAEVSLAIVGRLFDEWHKFKCQAGESEESRAALFVAVEPIRTEFKQQLETGQTLGDGKVKAFSKGLIKLEERLYLFVKEPGVEPTNNAAEQALRPAVIWRKKCFGNQSAEGERFVERVLSIRATCHKQGRNFLDYVILALKAEWSGAPAPILIATSATP
jgi:transposase